MDTTQFSSKDVDTIKNIVPFPLAKLMLSSLFQKFGEEQELDNIIVEDDSDTYTLTNILFLQIKASQTFDYFNNDYEKDIKLALIDGEEHQGEKCTFEIESDPVDIDATRLECYRIKCFLEDKNILQKEVEIGMKWQEYLRILQENVDQEQLQEWVRLLDFTSDYYRLNYDYLESRRNDLELATKGIESFNPKFSDTREAFDQFFQESINILSPKKAVQKEKEM